ncbi:MAG: alanine dehydrogenase, partial [Planctomycetota bacterium]
GAAIATTAAEVFEQADMIVKVKEPQPSEYPLVRDGQILFTYFHFAASESLTEAMLTSGATCLAYETLRDDGGQLPLLTPMSEVAGRMSIQEGAKYLEKPQGGAGVLLGGVPGVAPAHVTVLGGGVVGTNAARMAAGLGARVTILDVNLDRLRYLAETMPANVTTLYSDRNAVIGELTRADLVVGAVLVPGAKAPKLVRREDLQRMKPGSVLVDVAVDQGGCIETTKATTHQQPTYIIDGVVHYCVANMPGAVGRTSTFALCNATLPWIHLVAGSGSDPVVDCVQIETAINIHQGRIMHHALAQTFPAKAGTTNRS